MAESADWFREGALHYLNADWDWGVDTINFAVVDTAQDLDTTEFWDPSGDGSTGPISDEVTGTGWAAGGVALSSKTGPTLSVNADPDDDYVTLDAADIVEDPVTFTGATHGIIYVTGTGGTDDYVIGQVNFDGARSPSAGEFRVTWSADGVLRAVMAPAA